MPDFAAPWALSRKRLVDEIAGLSQNQLNWRLHPNSLSIGEMAVHVAGVEVMFGSQLSGAVLDETGSRLKRAATEGVVDEQPFPYSPQEIDAEMIAASFEYSKAIWEPLITTANPAMRTKEIKSALGPMISGDGAFARLSFHSAYHQGQAFLIKTAPGFPEN